MLTKEQQDLAIQGTCIVLGFLADSEHRQNARNSMPGFSDAAIFHHLTSLFWTLRETETIAFLNAEEIDLLKQFNLIYYSYLWVPRASSQFKSDASESELNRITPIAKDLLKLLRMRTCKTSPYSWWSWMMSLSRSIMRTKGLTKSST